MDLVAHPKSRLNSAVQCSAVMEAELKLKLSWKQPVLDVMWGTTHSATHSLNPPNSRMHHDFSTQITLDDSDPFVSLGIYLHMGSKFPTDKTCTSSLSSGPTFQGTPYISFCAAVPHLHRDVASPSLPLHLIHKSTISNYLSN